MFAPIYLSVKVTCLQLSNKNFVFDLDVQFGKVLDEPIVPILYDKDYSAVGTGGAEYIKNTVKESVESAITDYLKVNFDL